MLKKGRGFCCGLLLLAMEGLTSYRPIYLNQGWDLLWDPLIIRTERERKEKRWWMEGGKERGREGGEKGRRKREDKNGVMGCMGGDEDKRIPFHY